MRTMNIILASVTSGMMVLGCDRNPSVTTPAPPPTTPPATPSTATNQTATTPESAPPVERSFTTTNEPAAPAENPHATPPAESPTAAPPAPPATGPGAFTPPTDPKVATFAGLTGPKPVTWQQRPPQRQFSIAEFAVPGQDGHDQARLDVFLAGGSIQANIDRWKTQFRNSDGTPVEPAITELESDGMDIVLVEFAGEYRGMGMPSFTPNQSFLCAIVPGQAEQIFIRFVGPTGTIEANREAYMNLIRNLKKVEPEK